MTYGDDADDFNLDQALANAHGADREARELRRRKLWGEELEAVEEIAAAAWRRVHAIRRRMIARLVQEDRLAAERLKTLRRA